MANFEAFHWNISSSINLLFLKSDIVAHRSNKIYQILQSIKIEFQASMDSMMIDVDSAKHGIVFLSQPILLEITFT